MKNKLKFLVVIGGLFCSPYIQAQINFPYFNDLKGLNPADIIVANSPSSVVFTPDGIQLTHPAPDLAGAIVLDGVTFTSDNGLTISFDYDMYEGFELIQEKRYGEGVSLFLYDATSPIGNDLLGGPGARMGYVYDRRFNRKGLNKAYLGIAFDVFGNHKTRVESQIGIPENINNSIEDFGSHITIRGAMRHEAIGLDENGGTSSSVSILPAIYDEARFAGYPVLYTRATRGRNGGTGLVGTYLDLNNNSSTQVDYVPITTETTKNFHLRTEIKNPLPNDDRFRKVIINLGPALPVNLGGAGGFYITVQMQVGNDLVTLVDKYHYKQQFYYLENHNLGSTNQDRIKFIDATPPAQLKLGFMGITGKATQYLNIRNLSIDIAYKPSFSGDVAMYCFGSNSDIELKPFDNDLIYDGPFELPPVLSSGPDHIDYNSFRFIEIDDDGYFDSNLGTTNGNITTYVNPDQGTWIFNSTTGSVNFTPKIGFMGTAFVYYDAKGTASLGGPYTQEIYRSSPTRIEINVINCEGHINPQLPSGGVTRSDK